MWQNVKYGMKQAYIPAKEFKVNHTVEQLQAQCPFRIDSSTQLAITGVVSPRQQCYGLICTVTADSGETHNVVVRVSLVYYLAAKALLEFVRSVTGLSRATLPYLH